MMAARPDYRVILQDEFDVRRKRNPGYSLRAYARDLGMPASKLSEVLRGICGLSARSATRIAAKLRLSEEETRWFVLCVEARHQRSERGRARAEVELQALKEREGFDEISLERFKIIADWYHFALLELTEVSDFSSSTSWIADRLGISLHKHDEPFSGCSISGYWNESPMGGFGRRMPTWRRPTGSLLARSASITRKS